ncbi:uncharacterized protein YDL144C [Aspergillus udagawae]|uniref:2-dehydropantoate 2-reductase n=1 Tax=Aspergillus udagawae TaxID=91492 RepID=A0A8E0QN41_9EURO|nr:uncharacterized protein Aud_002392 [Aspergillus udagawae]GFF25146.1 uncharacterized protein YDL144C [Aspergillus udagawae]GFG27569.1 uncharacterized protein YDL144C [Aspergillus udagawae]GIC86031.1 hypothetical protein Aud_002392 [Aspergillus udagawae]
MPRKARVLLVGTGGIGTIAALNLERGGLAEVTCVLRSNYEAVINRGIEILSCEHGHIQNWRPTTVLNAVPHVRNEDSNTFFDYIVCTTKNIPDVSPSICDTIAPAVTPGHTVIVLIQNGLNIEKPFLSRFPQNVVLSGVSRCDAHEIAHGVIEQKEEDDLHIGAFRNPLLDQDTQRKAAEQFVHIYGAGGKTNVRHEPNWERDRWSKLVYNATLNPICALTGVNTGDLQIAGSALDRLVIPAMQEVVKVSQAVGIELPDDIIEKTIRKNPKERKIAPSMQKDMQKGNLLEHENLIGEVVREAEKRGVSTPILSVLYELCSAVQWRVAKERERH